MGNPGQSFSLMTSPVKIVPNSDVLFDWDNTLKKIERNLDGRPPKMFSAVSENILDQLINKMNCRVFILTAISNSFLGCEALKIEIERLGLKDCFLLPDDEDKSRKQETPEGVFWRWGNAITCGKTPKADVYMNCCRESGDGDRPVYFFDDEIYNVQYFEMVLPKSTTFHVVDEVPITLCDN